MSERVIQYYFLMYDQPSTTVLGVVSRLPTRPRTPHRRVPQIGEFVHTHYSTMYRIPFCPKRRTRVLVISVFSAE
jgi:hypothetical protein